MESASRRKSLSPFLDRTRSEIERALEQIFSCSEEEPHSSLFKAARYALLSEGKRLRPLLTLAATSDLGGDIRGALAPACAIELIHTYSLIHDDLPCMDDDDLRRGKPSLHKAFNEGLAVLTGDLLLTKAFELMATAPHLSEGQRVELVRILSQRSGSEGLIGGQVVDIAREENRLSMQEKQWINQRKTGALFSAALECGGIVANGSEGDLALLRSTGLYFGLAFQLFDDLEDGLSSPPESDSLQKYLQEALYSLGSLSKPSLELKALLVDFYDHVQTHL